MENAHTFQLTQELAIRVVTAPYFMATKLEAFAARGKGDYYSSHDLEDLITVVDGRQELLSELRERPPNLRSYIADSIGAMLRDARFLDVLPGFLLPDAGSQARLPKLVDNLRAIAGDLDSVRPGNE